jgi:CRISPR-associated protein Csm3
MLAKIEITGTIEAVTGIHIGGSSSFAAIGAVDSPVIRDVITNQPMIPGSSLKGKMRALLSRQYSDSLMPVSIENDDPRVKRLFGYAGSGKEGKQEAHPARLQFSDMFLQNRDELSSMEIPTTEIKFENSINRLSAVANPRQIERAVRGTKYDLDLIYNLESEEEAREDFLLIREGFRLLEHDYIGGSGSRGYGRIRFQGLNVDCVIGDCADSLLDELRTIIGAEQ